MRVARVDGHVAFSKFDPNRPLTPEREATTASGQRRIAILRWVNWIVLAWTVLGFGFIVYWMAR